MHMVIKTTGTSPSPSRDEQKLRRPEGQTPSEPKLTPDNVTAKLGRAEGAGPADVNLTPDHDAASRPGKQGRGSRRRSRTS
jgi:hypothetical protein